MGIGECSPVGGKLRRWLSRGVSLGCRGFVECPWQACDIARTVRETLEVNWSLLRHRSIPVSERAYLRWCSLDLSLASWCRVNVCGCGSSVCGLIGRACRNRIREISRTNECRHFARVSLRATSTARVCERTLVSSPETSCVIE